MQLPTAGPPRRDHESPHHVDRGLLVTSWRESGARVPLRPRLRSRTIAQHDEIETLDAEPSARSMLLQPVLAGELPEQLRPELSERLQDAERYAVAAQAQNTTRAYASDWPQFEGGASATA